MQVKLHQNTSWSHRGGRSRLYGTLKAARLTSPAITDCALAVEERWEGGPWTRTRTREESDRGDVRPGCKEGREGEVNDGHTLILSSLLSSPSVSEVCIGLCVEGVVAMAEEDVLT